MTKRAEDRFAIVFRKLEEEASLSSEDQTRSLGIRVVKDAEINELRRFVKELAEEAPLVFTST